HFRTVDGSLVVEDLAAGAGHKGGDHARGDRVADELHGAVAAQRVGAAGVEGVNLVGVVAVNHAAAAVHSQAVTAEAAHFDVGVVVGPGGVEGLADLAGGVGRHRLAAGVDLVPAGVFGDHERVRGAVRHAGHPAR